MKQISALALAATLALPSTVFAQEIKPLSEIVSTQSLELTDEYSGGVILGIIVIGGVIWYVVENDGDSSNGTNNTTGTN